MGLKDFRGEVWTNVHPEILEEIVKSNQVVVDGKVGDDGYTANATKIMQSCFKDEIKAVYAINGTAANVLALKSMLDRYSTVLCEEETHINTHECGALESMLGNKILAMKGNAGKLTPEIIDEYLFRTAKYKYLNKVIAITQPTELGVLYTNQEIKDICDFAHERGMYVYVDGARLSNALVALDTTITEMIQDTGVDAFSFGGTKAGAMFGEMVVFRRKEHFSALKYLQKQALQHLDKSKFLGVQIEYLLKTELWKKTAKQANDMAKYLESKLNEKGIVAHYPVETNMVFCKLNKEQLAKINTVYDLNYWEAENEVVRIATTFYTDKKAIDNLISLL